jgi:hypothetical protein
MKDESMIDQSQIELDTSNLDQKTTDITNTHMDHSAIALTKQMTDIESNEY